MKNITNSFNEIIISKTLSPRQNTKEVTNGQFSSLLNQNTKEELTQKDNEQEKPLETKSNPQLELQNISYLNKIFLSSVA